ncbi:MAG: carbohydrate ABC transporter permease [Candidatus Edwardsbacteria bacterium]|jgi:multiple sugar transport system permease protein|nr:carbohydrate ABC transporter permease [Candidatus Edwardsbacteria bacterium]
MTKPTFKTTVYLLLACGAALMVFPFLWMVLTALKTQAESIAVPPVLLPASPQLDNFLEVWRAIPLVRYFANTIIMTVLTLAGVLVTSVLAAFAFSFKEFRGRDAAFMVLLGMMMIPQPVYLVPSYVILTKLGWLDTFYALVVPWVVNIFSIFLIRQHFKTVPVSLYEAAKMDGAGDLRFIWHVLLPISRPVLVTVSLFSVIGSWNSFLWPLIVTNSDTMRPLQVGLAYFSQEQGSMWPQLMAASTMVILPLVAFYAVAQRQITESFAASGLKD